jgi:hypothetical protein
MWAGFHVPRTNGDVRFAPATLSAYAARFWGIVGAVQRQRRQIGA